MSESNASIKNYSIHRFNNEEASRIEDHIAVEAPLEIRIKKNVDPMSKPVAVTMRTPGDDINLALGFLFTEGILKGPNEIIKSFQKEENIVEFVVADVVNTDLKNADRNFYTTSSCGVCGKASIEAIKVSPSFEANERLEISSKMIRELPEQMNAIQSAFQMTGGIHASALFNGKGRLQELREDVGRHNALDKLIGASFKNSQLPLSEHILLLSGRASFELIQKAAMAGIQVVCAVGAPSSLAIDLAIEHDITLIGFLKANRFNIYNAPHRIN